MTTFRCGIALSIACSAVPAALLVIAMPAAAKPGGSGRMVEVGPIWNQADAEVKCAKAARKAGGTWTGQWRTTQPGIMSVCEIKAGGGGKGKPVEVGPIWNQADAEVKCAKAARKAGGTWTG
ncbi:MAG: mannan-binding protein, partial [Sphingomicrobium sp.]